MVFSLCAVLDYFASGFGIFAQHINFGTVFLSDTAGFYYSRRYRLLSALQV